MAPARAPIDSSTWATFAPRLTWTVAICRACNELSGSIQYDNSIPSLDTDGTNDTSGNQLFENRGGQFVEVSAERGIDDLGPTLAPLFVGDTVRVESEVVETDEWQEYIDSNYLAENIQWGEDFQSFLETTVNDFETTLEEAGAL